MFYLTIQQACVTCRRLSRKEYARWSTSYAPKAAIKPSVLDVPKKDVTKSAVFPPSYVESEQRPDEEPQPRVIFQNEETGFSLKLEPSKGLVDWSTSYSGVGTTPFPKESCEVLLAAIKKDDIEVKPDGLLYLPEIKYRRILNKAFGPGGWGMIPRGPHTVMGRTLTREYALIAQGRFVSQARGEQDFFSQEGLATATEGCKSNALVRCCKDLGVASELWDPVFIRRWKSEHAVEVWATDVKANKKKKVWKRKNEKLSYPYQE